MPTKLTYTAKGSSKVVTEVFRCKPDALDFLVKLKASPVQVAKFEIKEA